MQTLASVALFPVVLSLIVGVVIPHLVDLVTHSTAPWWFKSMLATALSVLTGILTTTAWPGLHDWKVYLVNVVLAFMAAFTSQRAGLSVPVRDATANFGVYKTSGIPKAHVS